ncbi:Histidine kinase-, DNA gyrase B-, and HSP90-like ATPase [Chishuiella changwenlii]|uniref:histidine kinase n=1 Tax=Chishuiella changwenlii TaxID=1434701 RepID=A0A1M7CXE4_9FLAO|nr:ATP-binding protein [Chishuiella changwenlii]GGF11014.1 sensor histidine kinase [Chishuiella changwenlii]SHL71912.1 Histidine kinase-, DNA gyrase B-, and HSP90-like ATPase [Chishuiella changwenlii]
MKKLNFNISLVIRILIITILLFFIAFFILKKYPFSITLLLIITSIVLIETILFIQKNISQNQKIIHALLHDDFSLNISQSESKKENSTVKLYQKIKDEHTFNSSKEILYHQLLNAVSSGFLILKKEENDRKIIFMNKHFQNMFNIPQLSSWNYLKKFIPQFTNALEERQFEEIKTTIDIQINGEERQTYVIQNSKTQITNEEYDVIFLDSIQRVIDVTEKEAWMNIMKVIAHEIINSLTPIYSLANTTKMYFESDELDKQDYEDIKLSLDTIMNRSQHLQTFIDQYRQLTMLPSPIKSIHNLSEIIQAIQQSFRNEFIEKNINFTSSVSYEITVNVDRIQLEQVFINLIKNAIYSVENSPERLIEISTIQSENRLQIIVHDSGNLIDETIVSKIFLPFYTTRKNGAGIGLTLSKTIIEAHKGYLFYKQNNGIKQFVIVLGI